MQAAARPMEEAKRRRGALLLVLVAVWLAFTLFSAIVLADYGLVGFIKAAAANGAVVQVTLDLAIALTIALVFVHGDARRRSLPFWPYVIATVVTGSIGLIPYLIHRAWRTRA